MCEGFTHTTVRKSVELDYDQIRHLFVVNKILFKLIRDMNVIKNRFHEIRIHTSKYIFIFELTMAEVFNL